MTGKPHGERRGRIARSEDRHERVGAIIAVLLMIAMTFWIHSQGQDIAAQRKRLGVEAARLKSEAAELAQDKVTLGDQHTSLVQNCQRLQILRVEDNRSHLADFLAFRAALATFKGHLDSTFARELEFAIGIKSWVPLTNCEAAVNLRGVRYRAPRPVPFHVRLPPKSAVALRSEFFR